MAGRPGPKAPHVGAPAMPETLVVVDSRADFHGQPKAITVVVRTPMGEYRGVARR